jgi:hypothetical protein
MLELKILYLDVKRLKVFFCNLIAIEFKISTIVVHEIDKISWWVLKYHLLCRRRDILSQKFFIMTFNKIAILLK